MKVYVVLSKSKVHSVCDTEEQAETHLSALRKKCGLLPGYDLLWKINYRIESVELNKSPLKI